jgi:lysozyme family protein
MFKIVILYISIVTLVAVATRAPSIPDVKAEAFRHNPKTHHEKLWDSAEINGSQVFRIDKVITMYLENKDRYTAIEKMRTGGVPSAIIFTLHGRESTWSFKKHLHEGSPLTGRTKWVPKGRPKAPPGNGSVYTFEESAEDVLYKLKDLESKDWTKCDDALFNIESYNGLGYLKFHKDVNSPYIWSGTNHYYRGKYVADGKYSRTAKDKQLGTCAILKRMLDRKIYIGFK